MSTMVCPDCGGATRSFASRRSPGNTVRRHRVCVDCEHTFTTYERPARLEVEDAAGRMMLSVPDVARRLGISRTVVYYMVRVGHIPAMRLGHRIWIDPDWIDQHRAVGNKGITLEPVAS